MEFMRFLGGIRLYFFNYNARVVTVEREGSCAGLVDLERRDLTYRDCGRTIWVKGGCWGWGWGFERFPRGVEGV